MRTRKSGGSNKDECAVSYPNHLVSTEAASGGAERVKATRLTKKQRETLQAIRRLTEEKNGISPSRSELIKALGLKHQGSIDARLQSLQRRGWVSVTPFVERGIRLLREGTPVLDPEQLPAVRAGTPMVAEEHGDVSPIMRIPRFDELPTPFEATPDMYLRVVGSSMDGAGLDEGDMIAIRRTPEPEDGDMVVARLGEEVTLKRYHRKSEAVVELQPVARSSEHEPIRVDLRTDDFECVGVVVGAMVRPGGGFDTERE